MDTKILNQILHIAFDKRVSDIHFEVDNPPFFRGRGQLIRSKLPNLTPKDTEFIATSIMEQKNRALSPDFTELDASYSLPDGGRYRGRLPRLPTASSSSPAPPATANPPPLPRWSSS